MQLLVGWGFVRVGVVRFSQPASLFHRARPAPLLHRAKAGESGRGNPGGANP